MITVQTASSGSVDRASHAWIQSAAAALQALQRIVEHLGEDGSGAPGVRPHLAHFRHRIGEVLAYGPMVLEVEPMTLSMAGVEVYRAPNREKSLALGLHRDGVRAVTIQADASWAELLALVEVVALQHGCGHLGEEDTVTCLRGRDVRRIHLELSHELEDSAPSLPQLLGVRAGSEHPREWDAVPSLEVTQEPVTYAPLSDAARDRLCLELSSEFVAVDAVLLVDALLAQAATGRGIVRPEQLLPLFDELRRALLGRGEGQAILSLLERLQALESVLPARVAALRRTFSGQELVLALVDREASREEPRIEELEARVAELPGDPLQAYLRGLEHRAGSRRRRVLVELLSRLAAARRYELEVAFDSASARAAADIMRALAIGLPGERVALTWLALSRPEPALQRVACLVLDRAEPRAEHLTDLVGFLGLPFPAVRMQALRLIEEVGGREAFEAVEAHLERAAGEHLPLDEVDALGRTLARIDPQRATPVLLGWIRPRRLWSRLVGAEIDAVLGVAAASGLAELDLDTHWEELERLAGSAGLPLRDHCLALLEQSRGVEAS